MAVNVLAPMRFTRLFAPSMAEHGSGTIVNIGSVGASTLKVHLSYHASSAK